MKITFVNTVIALMSIALPLAVTSCDDDNNNGGGGGGNSACLEGRTIQFIGTQTNTSDVTTPIASTTVTTIDFDLITEFRTGGISKVTGVTDIKQIRITVAGFTTDSPTGLGPIDVNVTGTYDCSNTSTNDFKEATVVEDGITTNYKLTYTSATSGTFETTVTGTRGGVTIDGVSNGTFNEL